MSALPEPQQKMTEAEYLTFERASEIKHEYIGGEIYAMTGASPAYNLIVSSINAALYYQLRGRGCRVFPSDQKVHTPAKSSYLYPDITVVCGDLQLAGDQQDVLTNPTVIIEVLSPSTERYDRGLKFHLYRGIESLQEYVLVSQDGPHVEHYLRQDLGGWLYSDAQGLTASLELTSIGCTLALTDVYEQVTFDAPDDALLDG